MGDVRRHSQNFCSQQMVQRRDSLDLGLSVAGPLEGQYGGVLGGFGGEDQANRSGLHVKLGHDLNEIGFGGTDGETFDTFDIAAELRGYALTGQFSEFGVA